MDLSITRTLIAITGVFNVFCYFSFLYTPLEDHIRSTRFGPVVFFYLLLASFIIGFVVAFIEPEECKKTDCDFNTTKIAMITCNSVTTLIILILFFTRIETSSGITLFSIFATILLVPIVVCYSLYFLDLRGVICLCPIVPK